MPDIQPPSFLRSATLETLSPYRAVYLIDVPEIGENAADALSQYVERGGGLAWFLGPEVNRESYNRTLLAQNRYLLPAPLGQPIELARTTDDAAADVKFGESSMLLSPLRAGGDAAFRWSVFPIRGILKHRRSTRSPIRTSLESERFSSVMTENRW